MRRQAVIAAGLVLLVTGCSSAKSEDIRTHGIKASITVTVTPRQDSAQATAVLKAGKLTFVELGEGDKLTASSGGVSAELKRHKAFGATNYETRLPGIKGAGTEVTVAFSRGPDDDSAPRSVVKLAEPLAIEQPIAGAQISRRSDSVLLRISSKPTDQPTEVNWNGSCISSGTIRFPSRTEVLRIPPGAFKSVAATPSSGKNKSDGICTIDLTVTRTVSGALDPAYGGGQIVAQAKDVRQISSRP